MLVLLYCSCIHYAKLLADDWKSDQYRQTNQAVTDLPLSAPKSKKYYYSIDTPGGVSSMFQRHAYKLISSTQNLTLVHYLGDNSVAVDFPHRSAKKISNPYFCTRPLT